MASVFTITSACRSRERGRYYRTQPRQDWSLEQWSPRTRQPPSNRRPSLKIPNYVKAKEANGSRNPFGPGNQPHFEIDFVPIFSEAFKWHPPTPREGNWLTVIVDLLPPISKPGYVKLRPTNPLEDPFIMNGEGMKDLVSENYPFPMPRHSEEAMNKMILERSQTGFHPCGTARLSKHISRGVVDGQLKVHGIKNLRVIDASVMLFPIVVFRMLFI
ncbi:GMC oxidoreductase-domain-containing protein [Aspergillus californicus]